MKRAQPFQQNAIRWLLICLVAAMILSRALPFVHRIFNWDELGLLSRAWVHFDQGWRSEARPGLVRLMLWPLFAFRDDQVAVMYGARALNAAAFVALMAGVWGTTRALYGRAAALLALTLLSFHSMFYAHSVEVRTETFSMAFVLLAITWAEARARAGLAIWPAVIAVVLGGLCSQKAIYPALWYAVAHVAGAGCRWRWRQQRGLLAAVVLPPLLALVGLAIFLPFSDVLPYVRRMTLGVIEEVRSPFYLEWVQYTYIERSVDRESAFYASALLGLPWLLRRSGRPRRRLVAAYASQALTLGIVWFHAARFPYFFLTLAPLWAIPAGYQAALALGAVARTVKPVGSWLARAGLAALVLLLAWQFKAQTPELFKDTATGQIEAIRALQSVFPVGTPAFDAHHLMIFHKQATTPLYSRGVNHLKKVPEAEAAFVQQLIDAQPVYYLQSKRTEKLEGAIRTLLDTRFVRVGPNLYMAGAQLSASGSFVITRPGAYVVSPQLKAWGGKAPPRWPAGRVRLDGETVSPSDVVHLLAGEHRLNWTGAGGVRLRLDWPGVQALESPGTRNVELFRPYK